MTNTEYLITYFPLAYLEYSKWKQNPNGILLNECKQSIGRFLQDMGYGISIWNDKEMYMGLELLERNLKQTEN